MFHKKIIVVFSFFFPLQIAYIILTGAIIASESGILIIIALHVWVVVIGATCIGFLIFVLVIRWLRLINTFCQILL